MSKAAPITDSNPQVGDHRTLRANIEPTLTKDLGEGIIEATITTGGIDHHNETILMEGVDTSQYHGTVLWGHEYDGLPIGKTISLTKMKSKIKAKFQLAIGEYPFAKQVYDLIVGGYITHVSIGGLVKRWSDDYQTIEEMVMKEFSIVSIGANPEAMINGIKALGMDEAEFKSEYRNFQKSILLDKKGDLSDDEIRDAIEFTKSLTARLEESAAQRSLVDDKSKKEITKIVLKDAQALATQSQKIIKIVKK